MIKNKKPTVNQLNASNKVRKLKESNEMNDDNLSKFLNISKVTMYTRMKSHNWTDQNILFIEYLSNSKLNDFIKNLKII